MVDAKMLHFHGESAVGAFPIFSYRSDAAGADEMLVGADLERKLCGVVEGEVADAALEVGVEVLARTE